MFSIPALANVGALLLLLFYMFAVVGMNLFGDAVNGEFFNDHANFRNALNAMLTLFRMATGFFLSAKLITAYFGPPLFT